MHYMLGFGLNSRVSLFLALFSLLEWVLLLCSAWKAGLLLDDRQFNDFLAANSPGRLHRRGKVKLGLASLLVWEFRMGKSQCRSTAVAMLLKLYTRSALLMLMRVALVTQPLDHRQNNNNYFMNHVEWNDKNEIFIYLKNKTKKFFYYWFSNVFQLGWLKLGATMSTRMVLKNVQNIAKKFANWW